MLALGHVQAEKPLLHRRQRHRARGQALIDKSLSAQRGNPGQAADGLMLEQVARAEGDPGLTGTADHLNRDDRVAAQGKKVVVDTDLRHAQHLLPDIGQALFQLRGRCDVALLHGADVRARQGFTIKFAVGRQRQTLKADPVVGHHVVRQAELQLVGQFRLPSVGRRLRVQHHVGHQLLAVEHLHHGFAHGRLLGQTRLDFPQFNAQPAQFDLMIKAAQVFNDSVNPLAYPIAGAVQAVALIKRARHKTLCCQRRAPVVAARQPGPAQIQLSGHAQGYGREVGIQHQRAQVGDGQANRHAGRTLIDAGPVRDVDGRFGRAIQVVQLSIGQFAEHLLLGINRQRFTAADNPPQASALLDAHFMNKRLQH